MPTPHWAPTSRPAASARTFFTSGKRPASQRNLATGTRSNGPINIQSCHVTNIRNVPQLEMFAQIAVKVETEADLQLLLGKARSLGLVSYLVADAGRTQIAAGSQTVLAVGPGPGNLVDQVTGGLKLF